MRIQQQDTGEREREGSKKNQKASIIDRRHGLKRDKREKGKQGKKRFCEKRE